MNSDYTRHVPRHHICTKRQVAARRSINNNNGGMYQLYDRVKFSDVRTNYSARVMTYRLVVVDDNIVANTQGIAEEKRTKMNGKKKKNFKPPM